MSSDEVSRQDKRFPASVYGVGEEPDPRFSLANERTFLAWIRTSLGMLAAGVAADALTLPMPELAQHALAVVLVLAGLFCAVQAWRGWARSERAMRVGHPLPSNPTMLVLVALLVVAAAVFVIAATVD